MIIKLTGETKLFNNPWSQANTRLITISMHMAIPYALLNPQYGVAATSIGMINFLLMDPPPSFLFGMPHRLNVACTPHTCTLYIAGQNIALSWGTWSPFRILMNLGDGWSWHELLNTGSGWSSNALPLDDMVHRYTSYTVARLYGWAQCASTTPECNPLA